MDNFQPLKGKVALITGGSRGIGAAITKKLSDWGATVCINYVDRPKPAKALADTIIASGGKATVHCADISEEQDTIKLIESVREIHSDIHILIHNAGASKFGWLEEMTVEQWDFVQNTNARSTWLLAKHALPLMKGRSGARYITITNGNTIKILPKGGMFAASKAAMESLTKYLAYELAPYGIVVNGVRPGLVRTAVFKVRPEFEKRMVEELEISPWRGEELTTVEKSADSVALMCLPEASWISGQIITVDGGYNNWGMVRATNMKKPQI